MAIKATSGTSKKQLRAVGYCRTSGEGQRDNTSIPRQKEAIEKFIQYNEWAFTEFYVDECKTGSKEDGRESFQQMIRDAANDRFDIIVVFDIKRFSRKGSDIIRNADFLRDSFSIHTVDTKNQFDTRDRRNTLINYVHAGVSEQERIDIMERMIGGRIKRAVDGLPWSSNLPIGRSFIVTCKKPLQGHWGISEQGLLLRELFTRYADGESIKRLASEYGLKSFGNILGYVRTGQLSGTYKVTFNSRDIDVTNVEVEMPWIPEVLSPLVEERVRARMEHNRTGNKESYKKYLLTGYVFCGVCGRALLGSTQKSYVYYRHKDGTRSVGCTKSVRGDQLEAFALDYLYRSFLDRSSFDAAVTAALPTTDDRDSLERDLRRAEGQLAKVNAEIANIVKAIRGGAALELMLPEQSRLIDQQRIAKLRVDELQASYDSMPNPADVMAKAELLRLTLYLTHKGKNWRELPYDEVRAFLEYLLGVNPKSQGNGIFVFREGAEFRITFKGLVKFQADVVNGRPVWPHIEKAANRLNAAIKKEYEEAVANVRQQQGIEPDWDNSCRQGRK